MANDRWLYAWAAGSVAFGAAGALVFAGAGLVMVVRVLATPTASSTPAHS